jgi:hypothetical protein
MLLPAFGNSRVTGKQGAKVLKRGPLGWQNEQRCRNGCRRGPSSPPTPKRNCSPFAQRHTTNVLPPPSRRVATTRLIFYCPINLAKVLTSQSGSAPARARRRGSTTRAAVSDLKNRHVSQ